VDAVLGEDAQQLVHGDRALRLAEADLGAKARDLDRREAVLDALEDGELLRVDEHGDGVPVPLDDDALAVGLRDPLQQVGEARTGRVGR
jgi:hypothetical protein